jgi:hypothetical protein
MVFGLINRAASWIRVIRNSLNAAQLIEVCHILRWPKICQFLYKPINGPIAFQTNPNHTDITWFLMIHCNIILPFTERYIQNNTLFLVSITENFCSIQIQTTWLYLRSLQYIVILSSIYEEICIKPYFLLRFHNWNFVGLCDIVVRNRTRR